MVGRKLNRLSWRRRKRERERRDVSSSPDHGWIAIHQSTLTCPSQGQPTFQDGSPHWLLDLNSLHVTSWIALPVPIVRRAYMRSLKFHLESSEVGMQSYERFTLNWSIKNRCRIAGSRDTVWHFVILMIRNPPHPLQINLGIRARHGVIFGLKIIFCISLLVHLKKKSFAQFYLLKKLSRLVTSLCFLCACVFFFQLWFEEFLRILV
jgi:hypothetical protein